MSWCKCRRTEGHCCRTAVQRRVGRVCPPITWPPSSSPKLGGRPACDMAASASLMLAIVRSNDSGIAIPFFSEPEREPEEIKSVDVVVDGLLKMESIGTNLSLSLLQQDFPAESLPARRIQQYYVLDFSLRIVTRLLPSRETAAVLALLVALASCSAHTPKSDGCGSARDCKLDRICDRGQCVWPSGPLAGLSPARMAARPMAERALTGKTPVEVAPAGPPAQGMFRCEPHHRGRSPYLLPRQKPEVRFAVETSAPVTASPTIAKDGLIVVGSHSTKVLAIDHEGGIVWSFATMDLVWSTPAIAAQGTVYVGSDDDHLYALDGKSGKLLWKYRVGACSPTVTVGPEAARGDVDAGQPTGPDGTIYTGGDGIYAIAPAGTLRWRYPTGAHATPSCAVPDRFRPADSLLAFLESL